MTTQHFLLKTAAGEQRLLVDRELIAGRDPVSDIVLDQGQASRKHAKLSPGEGGIRVEDLGSTNGTLLNGERLTAAAVMKVGDTLQMGKAQFHIELQTEAAAADSDATLLFTPGENRAESNTAPLPDTQPEPKVPQQPSGAEPADPKAPPSWVLNNQQSVDGTKFISKDMMQNVLSTSGTEAHRQEMVGEPTLVGNSDPVMGMRFQLIGENKNQWEIGRSPNSSIMLNHESVSSSHAQILHEGKRWKLVDLMSANGTYVNGKKCLTGYLAGGDVIRFGHVECHFMLPEDQNARKDFPTDPSLDLVETPAAGSTFKTAAIAFILTTVIASTALYIISRFL